MYGPSGIGKSVAAVQFPPTKCYYIATEREAVAPAYSKKLNPHWPVLPFYTECLSVDQPYEELLAVAQDAARRVVERPIVILDTLSSWGDREMGRIHRRGIKDDYGKASTLLHERLTTIVNTILGAGGIFIALAHEKDPSSFDGKIEKGGPRLPGKSSKIIPSLFSMVLRGSIEMDDQMVKRRVFRVDPLDSRYFTKDRYEVVQDKSDMNLVTAVGAAVRSIRELEAAQKT